MPARMLFGSSGSGAWTAQAAAPTVVVTLPTLADATAMQIRPALPPIKKFLVAQDGSGTHTSLNAALKAASDAQSVSMVVKGTSAPNPTMRVDIAVKPGTYTEMLTNLVPFIGIYAADPTNKPIIQNTAHDAPTGGVFYPDGSSHFENLIVYDLPNDQTVTGQTQGFDPKYCSHQGGPGAITYSGCVFENKAPASGGYGFAIGSDGGEDEMTTLYGCTLNSGGMNMHGAPAFTKPQRLNIVNTTVHNNGYQPVQFSDLGAGTADEVWIVNSTIDGQFRITQGANVQVNVDSASTIGQRSPVAGGKAWGTATNWPMPIGGMTTSERATYGVNA